MRCAYDSWRLSWICFLLSTNPVLFQEYQFTFVLIFLWLTCSTMKWSVFENLPNGNCFQHCGCDILNHSFLVWVFLVGFFFPQSQQLTSPEKHLTSIPVRWSYKPKCICLVCWQKEGYTTWQEILLKVQQASDINLYIYIYKGLCDFCCCLVFFCCFCLFQSSRNHFPCTTAIMKNTCL